MKILLYDTLTEETEKLFDALPTLIFSKNLSLRINMWTVWREEFRINDSLLLF